MCPTGSTWREGFAPSWQTELQGSYLPCGLPGSRGFLSTNGSHLNVRRINHAVPLRSASERLHACRCAIDTAAFGRDDTAPLVALDDLGDQHVRPRTQPRSSACTRLHGIAKGLPYGADVCHQAIGTEQQGLTYRTAFHAHNQPPDQRHVPLLADRTAQPQARLNHHG